MAEQQIKAVVCGVQSSNSPLEQWAISQYPQQWLEQEMSSIYKKSSVFRETAVFRAITDREAFDLRLYCIACLYWVRACSWMLCNWQPSKRVLVGDSEKENGWHNYRSQVRAAVWYKRGLHGENVLGSHLTLSCKLQHLFPAGVIRGLGVVEKVGVLGGPPASGGLKCSSVTFDWHVLLGWNGLISFRLVRSSWGGKLHLSLIPPPLFIDTLKPRQAEFIWWSRQQRQRRISLQKCSKQPRPSAWVPLENFGLWRMPVCSQMMSPESAAKFSHHLTQEMVFGRASTGFFFLFFSFLCLWSPHTSTSTPTTPTPLFLHLQLDWWSIFPSVTSCTKFSKGNRADLGNSQEGTWHRCWRAETEQRHGSYIQMKRGFCSSLSDSSCLQELIIAALNVALFTLFSFWGLKQYHSIEQTFRWGRIKTCSSVSFYRLSLNTQARFTNLKLLHLLLNTMSAVIYVRYNIIFCISITGPGIPKPRRSWRPEGLV